MARKCIAKRWIRSKTDERAVALGYYFDRAAADGVRPLFKDFLRHSQGKWAGLPFELQRWQFDDVIAPLFGWKRPDGTLLLRAGVAAHVVAERLGHSDVSITLNIYAHVLPDMQQSAADRLAAVLHKA